MWHHLKDIGLKNKGKDSDNICLGTDGERTSVVFMYSSACLAA